MKRIFIISLLGGLTFCPLMAQQTDPTLTGAVVAQSEMLKKIFKDREKTQKKIIAAETAVTVAMDRMHKVEDKMLEYLSNAQGAMQNLYQIKRAAELTTVEIPRNMSLLRQSLPGRLKGTAIALLVSDELTDAATQMASLYPFMKQLVTSGTYNVSGYDVYLENRSLEYINTHAKDATISAHSSTIPVFEIIAPDFTEHTFGALFYFFETACAISATMQNFNPFDQPGVEAYKNEMFRLLGKPGY